MIGNGNRISGFRGSRWTDRRVGLPVQRARGFTLVELLVAMLVIVILAGLIIVGITSIIGSGRDDSTETRMEMLDNFMAAYATSELSRSGGQGNVAAKGLPSVLQVAPGAGDYFSTFDGYSDATQNNVTDPARPREPLVAPGRFNQDSWIAEQAVARTQAVLRRLLSVPANQSAYSSLPADAKTGTPGTGGSILAHLDSTAPESALEPALVVDGHGNVIIFVPAEGMTDVRFNDGTTLSPTASAGEPWRVLAADGASAFWASAGPDGDFKTGDDNVYSTPVVVGKKP